MVIQIDGGSSNNKGAQLMLYAVLKEIEQTHPDAHVLINNENTDLNAVSSFTNLDIKKVQSNTWRNIIRRFRVVTILNKICEPLSYRFTLKVPHRGVDVIFNIGGFQFGDQWHHNSKSNKSWKRYLKKMQQYGTRVVFLPQAFGPFEKEGSKQIVSIIDRYSSVLVARDNISHDLLSKQGLTHAKLLMYPDFTSSVDGVESKYSKLSQGKVCIIPNKKMVLQGDILEEEYVNNIAEVVNFVESKGKKVFLLNHEGKGDQILCEQIIKKCHTPIDIYSSSNALVTKGIIATSYLVISSRFHGVANALNSCVPCLASSWSHKYQKLLEDYGMHNNIVDYKNLPDLFDKLIVYLDETTNVKVRAELADAIAKVRNSCSNMWADVWKIVDNSGNCNIL